MTLCTPTPGATRSRTQPVVALSTAFLALAPAAVAQLGPQQVISTQAQWAHAVHAADLDGDGDADVLSASAKDHKIAWYENQHADTGAPFCFGDGSGYSCPCGNAGGADAGCANSSGVGGVLGSCGSSSVGLDDIAFDVARLLPGQPVLLFAGENAVNGGQGVPFGDGLRCAGMHVVRLGTRTPDANGDASWGPGFGALGGWSAGDTRYFQAWYRDPSGPCGAGFNLTNGVELTFAP